MCNKDIYYMRSFIIACNFTRDNRETFIQSLQNRLYGTYMRHYFRHNFNVYLLTKSKYPFSDKLWLLLFELKEYCTICCQRVLFQLQDFNLWWYFLRQKFDVHIAHWSGKIFVWMEYSKFCVERQLSQKTHLILLKRGKQYSP